MGLVSWFVDNVLGIDPPKPPPPQVIKQTQVTEVVVVGPSVKQTVGPSVEQAVGPSVEQAVAPRPSADGESFRVLADALVASEALRVQGQVKLVNQLFKSRTAQALNGRQATQVPQPAINQITGESSTTGMAIVVGFLVVLAALTTSKRKGR